MSAELLQAMSQMVIGQNWQGFLFFRRMYISNGGQPQLIRKMISSLPDESQLLYGRYFNNSNEVAKRIKKRLCKERFKPVNAPKTELNRSTIKIRYDSKL